LHLFYSQAFDSLFFKHDATKAGFKRVRNCELPIDDFKRVLNCFCFQTYYRHVQSFKEDEVIEYLKNATRITGSPSFNPGSFLKDLLQSVCILAKDGLELTFTHKSFQEYFSALFILSNRREYRAKLIRNIHDRITLDSTFQLMFDMDRKTLEQDFLLPEIESVIHLVPADVDASKFVFLQMFDMLYANTETSLGIGTNERSIFDLYNFCLKNYRQIFPYHEIHPTSDAETASFLALLSGAGLNSGAGKAFEINQVIAVRNLVEPFWNEMRVMLGFISYFLSLPSLIRKEDSNSSIALEAIFNIQESN